MELWFSHSVSRVRTCKTEPQHQVSQPIVSRRWQCQGCRTGIALALGTARLPTRRKGGGGGANALAVDSTSVQSAPQAAEELRDELQQLRQEAQETLQLHPPQHTWLPEGCEDAPPEILAKLVQMTAGAAAFPTDNEVDDLWIEMDAAARAPGGEESVPSWSHARLREEGGESAFVSEFMMRCEVVEQAMKRGLWTEIPDFVDKNLLEVYVTHLTNDDYVVGAEILAASLAATGTTRPLVALVTDGLSSSGLRALRRAGWLLLEVGLMGHEGVDTPQARVFFSKIWLWALPFHKVIYIDTDILVLRNLDSVFEEYGHYGLAAAADSQPHMDGEMISQTGFLVLQPCLEHFSELWVLCSGSQRPMKLDDWKHFEQGFFTIYFDGGEELANHGGGCGLGWKELPAEYNFTVRYCKRPLFDGLDPANAAVVHFACAKPWDWAQKNYSPSPYVKMYIAFAKAAGIVWKTVECSADRARDRVNQEKMREIQAQKGL
ncbi:UDP-glucuronate:xylan alpha-glucuronosyltransferase 2 (UDP-GlcA:xylan glucuronyltransferase 2) (Glycogenin-like protein 2) (Plant glycogenin-like starch initiation protein 3) (Protein GLUCURONIC ACID SUBSTITUTION OF XYLAN 2) (AtGUX2) [Durusdinium trenchii]|uniref:Hexosyltransferase n=1 Tax=Durusdinium trenchii TaxID=1381693 RepID=A0ABP0NCI8_9DINO